MTAPHTRTRLSLFIARVMQTETAQRLVSWILAQYLRFVMHTTRWTYQGFAEGEAHLKSGRRMHALLWHNRIAMMPFAWRWPQHPVKVLISDHRDGRLVTRVLDATGAGYIRVPANALGLRERSTDVTIKSMAARAIRKAMDAGATIGVVGDGPTGPRFQLKRSTLELARFCDAEITLVTYAVKRRIVMRSWDRLIIPLPFNRGIFRRSARLYDPRKCDSLGLEALRVEIERDLRKITDETDLMMGHAPIE